MSNTKAEGTQRRKMLYSLDPVNIAYIEEKAEWLISNGQGRGKKGMKSEALNRIIEFVKGYEELENEKGEE